METEKPNEGQDANVQAYHNESVSREDSDDNLAYTNVNEEPELHFRTWIAVAAMLLLNYVEIFALQGPPLVLDDIGDSLHNTAAQTWVPNALSLCQAVLTPIFSSASDKFQARKFIMVGSCVISFIGAAIAPGSKSIYRLIGAQILISFGFSSTALGYAVPSEILPKKWTPMVQSFVNLAAALAAFSGPLAMGALCRNNISGWKSYFWIQMGLWGATAIFIMIGYQPPKRHTRYDGMSLGEKIKALDLIGTFLFMAGLTLFLVGLNLGGELFPWTNPKTLATLIVGIVTILAFFLYEWKGTKTGMAHHDLFPHGSHRGRQFGIFIVLIFIEGILFFAFIVFYPVLTTALFETDTFLLAARTQPFWLAGGACAVIWGYWSIKANSIRVPLCVGFLILTGGTVGLATIQPDDSTRACIFAGVAGIGFGAPLILCIAGVHLTIPHSLIATGTALMIASRAVSSAVFTAIYTAALTERLKPRIIDYVAKAALLAGLPATSLEAFIEALAGNDTAALAQIPGVTPHIIQAGVAALKQAYADSVRIVFIIAAPFGLLACALCFFLKDQSKEMTYRVEAPVENLHARHHTVDAGTAKV